MKRLPPHLIKQHGITDPKKRKHLQDEARRKVRDLKWLDIDPPCESSTLEESDVDDSNSSVRDLFNENASYGEHVCSDFDVATTERSINRPSDLETLDADTELDKFKNWLLSADGGMKSAKSSKQHRFQVKSILSAVDENKTLSRLLDAGALREKFMVEYVQAKQFQPGTTKSYLNSLLHWFKFMTSENDSLTAETKRSMETMHDRTKRWINSLKKQAQTRYLQKMDSDLQNLITTDDVQLFNTSKLARDAVKLIGLMSLDKPTYVSESDFVLVRDFLMCKIALNNASRSGVLANMTMQQFSNVSVVDGHYVISVSDHKTAATHGPAKVVLTQIIYSWLSVYVNDFRPFVMESGKESGNVFLSFRGEAMSSGQISKALQSVWGKAGLSSSINCTLIRKTAVSAVHKTVPESRADLTVLMSHRMETANKSYLLLDKNRATVAASQALANVIQGKGAQSTNDNSNKNADNEEQLDDTTSDGSDDSGLIPPSSNAVKKQRLYSDEELSLIKSLCKTIVSSGCISAKRVTEALNTTFAGQQLLKKFNMKQIISRIKYERLLFRQSC